MAYDLKATLKLVDEFTRPMQGILGTFDAVDRQMRDVNRLFDAMDRAADTASSGISGLERDTARSADVAGDLQREIDRAAGSAGDLGDAGRNAGSDLRRAGDEGRKAGDGISSAFKTAAGIIASVVAVDQIKDLTISMVESAGSAKAMKAQFSEVFGDLEGQATGKLGAISEETTILESRMKESFTKIAAFAKTGGMDTADSLDLADRSMRVIADSAAFYDKALDDTTESLQSFLKGKIVAPRRCEAA